MKSDFFSGLYARISAAFLIFAALIISIFTLLFYNLTSDILRLEDRVKTKESIILAADYISSYMDKLKSLSDIIAMHADIKTALDNESSEELNSIASIIKLAKQSDPNIKSISVVSQNGHVISSGKDMAVPITTDMMSESWYQKALASSAMPVLAPTGHGVFEMDNGDWIVSICREIKSDDNTHLGIVIIDVSYKFIESYISGINLGESGYVYILNSDKSIIYHPDKDVLANMDIPETASAGNAYYSSEVPGTDWIMYGIASGDNIILLQSRLIRVLFLIIFATILLSVIIAGIISRILSNPIIRLTNTMMKADKTWEHVALQDNASYEVKSLTKEYNNLIDRIRLLTENIKKEESARREFELKALQSQINPHFLYNTLDTILWLAQLGQNEAVEQVTSSLGKMLRISLKSSSDFIPLEIELEHTLSYLNIQKLRYEDMLSFEIRGEEGLTELFVPKLIIQPIVENAIYHGIRGRKKNGHIIVEYSMKKSESSGREWLNIRISDNGAGFDTGKTDDTGDDKDGSGLKPRELGNLSGGIGMKNVISRINILCRGDYEFDVSSVIGEGTEVSIKLPVIKNLKGYL